MSKVALPLGWRAGGRRSTTAWTDARGATGAAGSQIGVALRPEVWPPVPGADNAPVFQFLPDSTGGLEGAEAENAGWFGQAEAAVVHPGGDVGRGAGVADLAEPGGASAGCAAFGTGRMTMSLARSQASRQSARRIVATSASAVTGPAPTAQRPVLRGARDAPLPDGAHPVIFRAHP